ncbi:MAG: hypothetical protein M3Y91_04425 [Actinomycetota bacterium]|nr:hypothetical protein [Actinomycetota bacterium]
MRSMMKRICGVAAVALLAFGATGCHLGASFHDSPGVHVTHTPPGGHPGPATTPTTAPGR